jgi:adenine phosphoribosyltransferase
MYINGLKKGDTVILVDDVLSTGGTLKAVLYVLKEIGVLVKGVFIAVYKGTCKEEIMNMYDVPITTTVDIEVIQGKVTIK